MTTEIEQIKQLEEYIKDAFGMDGECEFDGIYPLLIRDDLAKDMQVFKLTDSKRGNFLIGITRLEKEDDHNLHRH